MEETIQKIYITLLLNIEVIRIYQDGTYIMQTFKKNKTKAEFLPEAKLKNKIEQFKSIKEEEIQEKRQAEILQKELEELLKKQAQQLERSYNRETDLLTMSKRTLSK